MWLECINEYCSFSYMILALRSIDRVLDRFLRRRLHFPELAWALPLMRVRSRVYCNSSSPFQPYESFSLS